MLEGRGMRVTVVAECVIASSAHLDDALIEQQADAVMNELLNLEADDPSVGGSLAKGYLEVEVSVESVTLEEALATGASQIRAALHAAGVGTADWPCDRPTFWLGIGQDVGDERQPA